MPIEVESCPACASGDKRETGPSAPAFVASAGDLEFTQPSYRIVDCGRCGLLYRDRTLSGEEFARYYAACPFTKWETTGLYPTEAAVLSVLRALPRRSRILDFGCSSGRLLAGLAQEHECHGFEINPEAAAAAAAKGLQMLPSGLSEDLPRAHFDAVLLVDVFEHLTAPMEVLSGLAQSLKPGGRLIIVTGDGDAPACRRDPGQFWYFRIIEHLSMLTRRHAGFIAAEIEMSLTSWQNLSHYELTAREVLVQQTRNFAYWQFRNRTLLAKTVLPFVPLLRRAQHAKIAPTFTCSPDHVLAVFERPPPPGGVKAKNRNRN